MTEAQTLPEHLGFGTTEADKARAKALIETAQRAMSAVVVSTGEPSTADASKGPILRMTESGNKSVATVFANGGVTSFDSTSLERV